MIANDKHSSLLQTYVNYYRKSFIASGPCCNVNQVTEAKEKPSSLLQTYVNYDRKTFYSIGPLVSVSSQVTAILIMSENETKMILNEI
jgi:hypothetical protein